MTKAKVKPPADDAGAGVSNPNTGAGDVSQAQGTDIPFIDPTLCRLVLYWPVSGQAQNGGRDPVPAIITKVHGNTVVDLMVMWSGFGATPSGITSISYGKGAGHWCW